MEINPTELLIVITVSVLQSSLLITIYVMY